MSSPSPAMGIRERNRLELTAEILAVARKHLVEHGPSSLSLRAITRDLGMASSAIYRYFASRDDLLTALIIEAYHDLADAVDNAEQRLDEGAGLPLRLSVICHGIRAWAKTNPHRWALIYGTPIIGYAAPQETIAAATRATNALRRLLQEADQSTDSEVPVEPVASFTILDTNLQEVLHSEGLNISEGQMMNGLTTWAEIVGLISLELFGHLNNVVSDYDAHFDYQISAMALRHGFS